MNLLNDSHSLKRHRQEVLESKKVLAEFSAALRDLKVPIRASRLK